MKNKTFNLSVATVAIEFTTNRMTIICSADIAVQEWTVIQMVEYIEKQKAIKLLDMCMVAAEKRWKEATNPLAKIEFKADKDTIEAMIEVVVSVESADVQQVKRGYWEKGKRYLVCSNCGMAIDTIGYTYEEQDEVFRYCPCCGFRMDGDSECQ